MSALSEQILLKISPELDKLIDDAFSKQLKETGEYISRSEYIRRILQAHCESFVNTTISNGSQ
jgi:Arc/MetJ-type ribon-helix-helix transcriptional regulator